MRAWLLDDGEDQYRLGDVAIPEPGTSQVRIKVERSALNHMDLWLTRRKPAPPSYPHIGGGDVVGVVEALGAGATGTIGQRVIVDPTVVSALAHARGVDAPLDRSLRILGEHCWGGHAEYLVVDDHQLVECPANRSLDEAAALPVAGATAWRMLRRARLSAGDRVLIVGIGGGVSTAALTIANYLGAEVFVTSRDPDKRSAAMSLGAAGAFVSGEPVPVKVDVVVESVGPATFEASMAAMVPGGRMVICGGTSGPEVTLNLPRLFFKQYELIGSTMGSPPEFADLISAFAAGLPVVVDTVVPFGEYPAALDRLRSGAQLGKVVLGER